MHSLTKTKTFCRKRQLNLCYSLLWNRERFTYENVQKYFDEASTKANEILDKNGIAFSLAKNIRKDKVWIRKNENQETKTNVEPLKTGKFSNMLKKAIDVLEELSHMDEVRKSQERVMQAKDKLIECSEYKREILRNLSNIREKIQENHNATANAQRGTKQYVELVQCEFDLLNEEKNILNAFREADDKEHLLLNELSTSITDSYEKEKIHSNSLKLWGFVGTLLASIVTFIASLIGYFYHTSKFGAMTNDFRQSVDKSVHKETILIKKEVDSLRKELQKFLLKTRSNELSVAMSSKPQESWSSYLNRHTRWTYSWMLPKKSTSN